MSFNSNIEHNTQLFALVSEQDVKDSLQTPVSGNEEFSNVTLGKWQLKELLLKQRVMTVSAICHWLEDRARLRYETGEGSYCLIMKELAREIDYLYEYNRLNRDI